MAVRRGKPVARKAAPAPSKRGRPAAKRTPAKAAPTPVKSTRGRKPMDITDYATKEPTDYHKAFARWIKDEVGFDPNSVSPMKAFLMGVSISTAARAKFMESEFLTEWRKKSGEVKRGPKASQPVDDDDDDFEDEESEELEDSDDDDFDDESEEDDEDDDDFDDEDDESEESEELEDSDDDDDFEDEEEEPEPPARTKRPVKKSTGNSRTRSNARSTTKSRVQSGKSTSKRATSDDDEMLF